MSLLYQLDRLPPRIVLALSGLLMLGITTADYLTGRDLTSQTLY